MKLLTILTIIYIILVFCLQAWFTKTTTITMLAGKKRLSAAFAQIMSFHLSPSNSELSLEAFHISVDIVTVLDLKSFL